MTREMSLLQQEQTQSLIQIGGYLRQVREDYALSLDEVSSRTLIQPRLLRAIEEGRLEQLPEPVYIQGFIRRYAEALGLDGQACADAFPAVRLIQTPRSWKDSPEAQLRPLHLYLAYIALIMASVSLLSYLVNRSAPVSSPIASPQIRSQGLSEETASSTAPASSPSASPATPGASSLASPVVNPDKPVRIDVKLTAQSWLRVEVDGQTEFEGVLPEGTERSWAAKNELIIRSGNAGGVLLAYNGGRSEQMGVPGAVEEKTFTAAQDSASLPAGVVPQSAD